MVRHCLLSVLFLLLLCVNGPTAVAQADLRAQLFLEAEKALSQAREKQAEIYAPRSFAQGMDAYNEADDYFKRGKPLDKIQDQLNQAVSYFTKSVEASTLGENTFSDRTEGKEQKN